MAAGMEFRQVIRRRRMVRDYEQRELDIQVVRRVREAGLRAPSAGFTQGWAFLVCDTPQTVGRFWAAATPPSAGTDRWSEGMRRAPVVVVALSSKQAYLDRYARADKSGAARGEAAWPVPYWDVDTGMAALLMLLSAVDEGLAACFFGVPGERVDDLRGEFGIPATYRPVGAVTLGHPAADDPGRSPRRGRKGVDDVVHHGRWGRTGYPAGNAPPRPGAEPPR